MELESREKFAKELLAALRADRKIAEQKFQSLSINDQVELINSIDTNKARELIFLSKDAKVILNEISNNRFSQLSLQEYLEDSLVLFSNCTPDQFTHSLDLDVWRKGQIDPKRFLEWVEIIKEIPAKQFRIISKKLDHELLATCLSQYVVIKISVEELLLLNHTDNVYNFDLHDIDIDNAEVEAFVKYIHVTTPDYFQQLIQLMTLGDLESTFNEAKGFRDDRVQKDKLPSYEEAQLVYHIIEELNLSPLNTHSIQNKETLPNQTRENSFSEKVLKSHQFIETFDKYKLNEFKKGLSTLINFVLVADGVSPTDENGYRNTISKGNIIYHIGLEFISDRSIPKAVNALLQYTAIELFQIGYTLIEHLRSRANSILDDDEEIIARFTKEMTLVLRLIDFPLPKIFNDHIKNAQPIKNYSDYLYLFSKLLEIEDYRKEI